MIANAEIVDLSAAGHVVLVAVIALGSFGLAAGVRFFVSFVLEAVWRVFCAPVHVVKKAWRNR